MTPRFEQQLKNPFSRIPPPATSGNIAMTSARNQAAAMNREQAIRTAARIGGFCARHLLATLVMVSALCVLWTVTYFALLIWAAVSGGGLGSPANYPLGLLLALVGGTLISLALFLPATALAEWIAKRRGLPILAQIPISIAILAALCLLVVGIAIAAGMQATFRSGAAGFAMLFLAHLLPLGLYWWIAQSGPLLVSFYKQLCRLLRAEN
jgi:hypothetical protein